MRRVIAAANPGNATGPLGKLSAHAPAIQVDMDDPNMDWGDPLVIDVWGRYWRVLPLSGGLLGDSTLIAPIENVDGGGGSIGGGTSTCETREQCISRRIEACEQQRRSCKWDAVGVFLAVAGVSIIGASLGALLLGAETGGVGALVSLIGGGVGVTIAAIGFISSVQQCNNTATNCINDAPDLCNSRPLTCP